MDTQPATQPATLADVIAAHGVSVRAEFVPFSKSRNAKEKHRSLNWRVTLVHNGRDIITTDYSAGEGHCPSYKQNQRRTLDVDEALRHETEKGAAWMVRRSYQVGGKPILPDAASVVASLLLDSSVLDASSFEEWAEDLGHDPDSRAHEKIYRACLVVALKVRNNLPAATLAALTEAARDF